MSFVRVERQEPRSIAYPNQVPSINVKMTEVLLNNKSTNDRMHQLLVDDQLNMSKTLSCKNFPDVNAFNIESDACALMFYDRELDLHARVSRLIIDQKPFVFIDVDTTNKHIFKINERYYDPSTGTFGNKKQSEIKIFND